MKTLPFLLALLLGVTVLHAQESYGTIKATTKLRGDGSKITTIVDPDKQTAEETIIDAAGKVQRRTTYLLGENNYAVEAIFADAKGGVIYKASYQRDGVGRVTEAAFTSPDGRYLGKRRFVYGSGDTARVEDYDANNVLIVRPQPVGRPVATPRRR